MLAILDDRCHHITVKYRSLVFMNVNCQNRQIWSQQEIEMNNETCNVNVRFWMFRLSCSNSSFLEFLTALVLKCFNALVSEFFLTKFLMWIFTARILNPKFAQKKPPKKTKHVFQALQFRFRFSWIWFYFMHIVFMTVIKHQANKYIDKYICNLKLFVASANSLSVSLFISLS